MGEDLNVHSAGHDNYVAPRIVCYRERLRAMRQPPKHDHDDNGLAARGASWTGGDYCGENLMARAVTTAARIASRRAAQSPPRVASQQGRLSVFPRSHARGRGDNGLGGRWALPRGWAAGASARAALRCGRNSLIALPLNSTINRWAKVSMCTARAATTTSRRA